MKSIFLIISVAMFSFCCKPASYTLQDYKGKKLTIANGGGFTGQVIEYTLFENGQVFRKNSLKNIVEETKRLKKNSVEQVFKNYDFLQLDKIQLNKPGNMYYYIVMDNGESIHKILWNADIKTDIDKNVSLFYQTVLNSVSTN